MKVFFLVLLVPLVSSKTILPKWAQDATGLVKQRIIRPNVINGLIPSKDRIGYQYYDDSWRIDRPFVDEVDYDDVESDVDGKLDWDRDADPLPPYPQTPAQSNAPENIWFVFPRAMASKIRELAWRYFNMATRASKARKHKKRQTKLSNSHSKPIAYQYYDESWLRTEDNYDDFGDENYIDIRANGRLKRSILSPNIEKEFNDSHTSSNHSDNVRSPNEVEEDKDDSKFDDGHKLEINTNNVVQRRANKHEHGSAKHSVTDYLFDTLFGIAEQILAVKHKEREIASDYLSEDIDILEILIAQDGIQLSKYLVSKSLLQKIDQLMAVQVGTTLLLKRYKEKNLSKKEFYEQVKLAFSNDEQDQLKFLNDLVESTPGLVSSKGSDFEFKIPFQSERKKKHRKVRRTGDKISKSALKDIINHYITVHFEVTKKIFIKLYNEGKMTKEELDISIERLQQANSPERNAIFRNNIETVLDTEIASSLEYGRQLLIQEYNKGKFSKAKYDVGLNYPSTLNIHELKMKIMRGLIESELEEIPKDDATDIHIILKGIIEQYSLQNEERDPNQTKQDNYIIRRVLRNIRKQIFNKSD